tara:strand:+ start:73818 stop:74060 length:243 start_codon:yes stop_codon:yes gene_type:complete
MCCGLPGKVWAEEDARYFDETRATTLFAFDDVSIPFMQILKLEMRSSERFPANPVLRRGGTLLQQYAVHPRTDIRHIQRG